MNIEEIKESLKKKATVFSTGGICPTNELHESWIGKVGWKNPGETHPTDETGLQMIPLATLFLDNLENLPNSLSGIKLITIFMNNNSNPDDDFDYVNCFEIRTYNTLENLIPCNYTSDFINAFPLVPKSVDNDYPQYEDLDKDLIRIISEKEENEDFDYYEDICIDSYSTHKIGGYPSSIQGGVGFPVGFEFVFQITSDPKANINIVDSGNLYFGYNPNNKKWSVRCDFY